MRDSDASSATQQQGQICAFFDHEQFRLGIIQSVTDKYCSVVSDNGDILNLSGKRFVLVTSEIYPWQQADEVLRKFNQDIRRNRETVVITALWRGFKSVETSYSLTDLISACNLPSDDVTRFGLYLSLREHPAYFHLKKGLYRVNSEEEFRQYQATEQQHQLDDLFYQEIGSWLQPSAKNAETDNVNSFLTKSSRLRLENELAATLPGKLPDRLKDVCHALFPGHQTEDYHLILRKSLGQVNDQTNPLLARSNLPCLFSETLLRIADEVPDYKPEPARRDLTGLESWTIDAAETRDIDDAVSLCKTNNGWELGIHISDVADIILPGSELDLEAYRRTSSIYLPDSDIHMLPEAVSCNKASLQVDKVRPALSLLCNINTSFEPVSAEFVLSYIKVNRRFTYEVIDGFLGDGINPQTINPEQLSALLSITDKHRQWRLEHGAKLLHDELQTPARHLVAECMVIYNRYLAAFTREHQLPVYYRHLEDSLPEPVKFPDEESLQMPPSILGIEPIQHQAMGLGVYAQATSPLRRYSDLINQRQVIARLSGQTLPYAGEQLLLMLPHLMQTRQAIRQLTYRAEQFRHLSCLMQENPEQVVTAVVHKVNYYRTTLHLPDYDCRIHTTLPSRQPPGTGLRIRIKEVNPLTGNAWVEIDDPESGL